MQQRRLRLGDIVDDYCPRERRITNHAIVAMIEDAVKQTRCTTCDADHEYKGAKVPAQRRKKDGSVPLREDAPAAIARKRIAVPSPAVDETIEESPADATPFALDLDTPEPDAPAVSAAPEPPLEVSEPAEEPAAEQPIAGDDDDGPVHRRLIRATLPRPEGQAPERKEPEFTAHQRGDANGNRPGRGPRRGHRSGQGRGQQGGGGARFGSGPMRSGQGSRQGSGFGGGQQRQGGHGQRQNGGGRSGHNRGGGRKRGR